MTTYHSDNADNQKQLDDWDPDAAKIKGNLKAPIEFKTDGLEVKIEVKFDEPKEVIVVSKKAKIVSVGKRNKGSLF